MTPLNTPATSNTGRRNLSWRDAQVRAAEIVEERERAERNAPRPRTPPRHMLASAMQADLYARALGGTAGAAKAMRISRNHVKRLRRRLGAGRLPQPGFAKEHGKLNLAQAREIRAAKGRAKSADLAAHYGVHPKTIQRVWAGRLHPEPAQ